MQTWTPFLLPALIATLLIFVPGTAAALATGRRGVDALLLAPVLSTSVVALSAIVFGPTGLHWGVWMVLAVTLALCLVAVAIRRTSTAPRVRTLGTPLSTTVGSLCSDERSTPSTNPSTASREPGRRPRGRALATNSGLVSSASGSWVVLALVLGAILSARHLKNVLVTPDAISQTFDNIFHLSAVQYILDTGDASSLTLSSMNALPGNSEFYPAAWHDLVSLVVAITGTSIPIATNATLYATLLAWLSSCMFLTRSILPASPVVALATGVLSASFTAYPLLAMDFGVLYPNLLGLALAPVVIALGVQLFRVTKVRSMAPSAAFALLLLAGPGVALAHPNAAITIVVFATAVVAVRIGTSTRGLWRSPERTRRLIAVITLAIVWLAFVVILWSVIRPPRSQLVWSPFTSYTDAVGQALLNAPLGQAPAWFLAALVAVGLYRCVRRRENVWLPVAWVLLGYCWVIIAAQPFDELRLAVTGVWYTDPYRVAMALPLVCLPLAVHGTLQVCEVTTRLLGRAGDGARITAVVCTILLVLLTQKATYLDQAVDTTKQRYALTATSALLTSDEMALIRRLPAEVPADDVVATDPWNGSSLAYPLAGVRTTSHHATGYTSAAELVLRGDLHHAAEDPQVCAAISQLGVRYVLDFGTMSVGGPSTEYPGFTDLAMSPGFELVDEQGEAKLYRITACGLSG